MMRIGFDVSQTAEAMGGCGIVADQLLRHLAQAGPGHEFVPYPVFGGYRNPAYRQATRPPGAHVRPDHFERSWEELNAGWDGHVADVSGFFGHPDVIHSNNFSCPPGLPAPVVYTVYDMSPVDHPEFHTEQNRIVCFNGLFDASLRAAKFIAISRHTRDRFLVTFPHVPPERVEVVYPAPRAALVSAGPAGSDAAVLARHGLAPDRYWLGVGTLEPRKNYRRLLAAYAGVAAEDPDTPPLVVAGQPGWIETSLDSTLAALGVASRVRALGYVPDEDLGALYRNCFGFVFPSCYEGFGLPVVEALACGAAVVAGRNTSIPEVVGDAGLTVDVDSDEAIGRALLALQRQPALRGRLRAGARAQAARFSWRAAAERVLEIYQEVVSQDAVEGRRR